MRLPTECRRMAVAVMMTALPAETVTVLAQGPSATIVNAAEYVVLEEGDKLLNDNISSQAKKQGSMAAMQGAISTEFSKMKTWEAKYVSYLKTARGFAETVKAGTTIYADGMQVMRHILEINRAIQANPEGIGATLCMSDIYAETAFRFIKVFNLLKETVAKGGNGNMLNATERNELLWQLSDDMCELKERLGSLAISLAFYDFSDVWWQATAGMANRSYGEIARHSFKKWKDVEKVRRVLNP